jgi:uncharacterized protein YukE
MPDKSKINNTPREQVPSLSKVSVPTPGAVTSTSVKIISSEPSDSKIIIRTQAVKEFEEAVKTFSDAAVAVPVNLHHRTKKLEDEIITTCTRIRKLEQGSVPSDMKNSDMKNSTAFQDELGELKKIGEDMKGYSERIQANYSALKKMFTKVCSNSDTQKLAIDKIFQEIQEIKELCKKKSESSSDSDSESVSSPKPSPSDGEDEEEHPVPKRSKKSNLF